MTKEKKLSAKDLEKKIEELEKQKKEYLAGWQRERADFINYKKDEMQKISELVKYANSGMVLKLLPVLDNFDSAQKSLSKKAKNSKEIKGLLQIKEQIKEFLKDQGIEEMQVLNKQFDPALHEVVEMTSGKESGKIIEEIQKGYLVHGKILRPAKVKVIK